jgi:hypothetical protein
VSAGCDCQPEEGPGSGGVEQLGRHLMAGRRDLDRVAVARVTASGMTATRLSSVPATDRLPMPSRTRPVGPMTSAAGSVFSGKPQPTTRSDAAWGTSGRSKPCLALLT